MSEEISYLQQKTLRKKIPVWNKISGMVILAHAFSNDVVATYVSDDGAPSNIM
jgi:hypothetical protein